MYEVVKTLIQVTAGNVTFDIITFSVVWFALMRK